MFFKSLLCILVLVLQIVIEKYFIYSKGELNTVVTHIT